MVLKIFFFLIVFLLSSFTNAQWLVDGGNLIWPYGTIYVKSNSSLSQATNRSLRNGGSWWAAVEGQTFISDSDDNLSMRSISGYFQTTYNKSSGVNTIGIGSLHSLLMLNMTATSSLGTLMSFDYPYESGYSLGGFVQLDATHNISIDGPLTGILSWFNVGYTGSDTTDTWYGYFSGGNRWGGSRAINNWFSYYSQPLHLGTSVYHFYGEGDYPSYFGGAIIQKVYTPDVSNPPTSGELDAEFGSPAASGSGFTVYIDDNAEGSNFYQVVSDGAVWWVFTASQAP